MLKRIIFLFIGLNCNDPKNFCLSQNCNGRGTCRNIPGVGYECLCSFGYEGDDCEVSMFGAIFEKLLLFERERKGLFIIQEVKEKSVLL